MTTPMIPNSMLLINQPYGHASGVTLNPKIENQLVELNGYILSRSHRNRETAMLDVICEKLQPVTILKSLWVDPAERGLKRGSSLLTEFIEKSPAGVVILICNLNEQQSKGFSLQQFYEHYGFKFYFDCADGPLMVLTK